MTQQQRDYDVINRQRSMLQMLGYDSYMIFVNTSLEVALERNRIRTRMVPEDITMKERADRTKQYLTSFKIFW